MNIMIIFYLVELLAFGRIAEVAVAAVIVEDPLGCSQEARRLLANSKDFAEQDQYWLH